MFIVSKNKIAAALLALTLALPSAAPVLAQSTNAPSASSATSADKAPRKYTFFMHLKTRDAWLQLSREDRLKYLGRNVFAALQKYPAVKMRHFDA